MQGIQEMDKLLLIAGEENPVFFAEFFLGISLNPFNKRALLSLITGHKEIMWVTGNQVGKTVTLAILHIWFNFYKKGFNGDAKMIDKARYETLNLSPISRQATEAFRYVEEILHGEFSWEVDGKRYINKCKIEWFFEGKNENIGRLDFSNNSSLHCLSTVADQGSGLAGKQFAAISYDECVQSGHLEEELGARIYSRTAKYSGYMILVSTPDEMGKSQQYWYHLYTEAKRALKGEGKSQWYMIEGLYNENIFIPEKKRKEFIERLKIVSPMKYLQVIKGDFLASTDRMFPPNTIEGLWNGKKEPTPVDLNKEYVLIIDWGVADGGDETVMVVADVSNIDNVEVVNSYKKQGGDPIELMAMAGYLRMEYNDCPIVMDATEMGGTVFKKMMKQFTPIAYGQGNKPDALFFLQLRLRNNIRNNRKSNKNNLTNNSNSAISKLKSYYLPKLERQLGSYKLDDKKITQDWVMVMSMLAWYVEKYKKTSQVRKFSLNKFYS